MQINMEKNLKIIDTVSYALCSVNVSYSQSLLHHYRFKIWLWNSLKYITHIL